MQYNGSQTVLDIRDDLGATMNECREVTEKYRTGRSAYLRIGQLFMRLFAGLLQQKEEVFDMCTAATYKTKDFYMGRTLDYEFSYGEHGRGASPVFGGVPFLCCREGKA